MKTITFFVLLALTPFILSGCEEEEEEPQLPLPPTLLLTVSDIVNTDQGEVTHTDEFFFDDAHRLTKRLTTQTYVSSIVGETSTLQHETALTYADKEVTVTDAFGCVSVYTLNDLGYASSCLRREASGETREYTFHYSTNSLSGTLFTEITETIGSEQVAEINLQPLTANESSLTLRSNDFTNSYHLITGEVNTSRLPWFYLTELYPLSLHIDALYAHLLGDGPEALLQSVRPEGSEHDEITTYTYQTDDEGLLQSSTEKTLYDKKSYQRKITYIVNGYGSFAISGL